MNENDNGKRHKIMGLYTVKLLKPSLFTKCLQSWQRCDGVGVWPWRWRLCYGKRPAVRWVWRENNKLGFFGGLDILFWHVSCIRIKTGGNGRNLNGRGAFWQLEPTFKGYCGNVMKIWRKVGVSTHQSKIQSSGVILYCGSRSYCVPLF